MASLEIDGRADRMDQAGDPVVRKECGRPVGQMECDRVGQVARDPVGQDRAEDDRAAPVSKDKVADVWMIHLPLEARQMENSDGKRRQAQSLRGFRLPSPYQVGRQTGEHD